MIEIDQASKTFFPNSPNEVRALDHCSLRLEREQFTIMIGSNGSGKSTLLNLIGGSLKPDTGKVLLEGKDITSSPEFKRSEWIARIFQNPLWGTAPDLSILDNFRLASIRTHKKELYFGINEAFKNKVKEKISILGMGLENKLDQMMGSLSGGQRQALTLVMAIMDDAKILLMDEPTAALDVRSAFKVMETANSILRQYKLTGLLVTHNLRDAVHYGDRILQMREGKIIQDKIKNSQEPISLSQIYSWMDQEILKD